MVPKIVKSALDRRLLELGEDQTIVQPTYLRD
jgi:hypothetical protein